MRGVRQCPDEYTSFSSINEGSSEASHRVRKLAAEQIIFLDRSCFDVIPTRRNRFSGEERDWL